MLQSHAPKVAVNSHVLDYTSACSAEWKISNNTNTNYANQGFVTDANVGFGRNTGTKDVIQVGQLLCCSMDACLHTYMRHMETSSLQPSCAAACTSRHIVHASN